MKNADVISLLMILFFIKAEAVTNINTADYEELQRIKGIGPHKAQAIIIHRNVYGKFHNINQLSEIKGFSEKSINKLAPQIEAK